MSGEAEVRREEDAQEELCPCQTLLHLFLERRPRDDASPAVLVGLLAEPRLEGLLRVLEVAARVDEVRGAGVVDDKVVRRSWRAICGEVEAIAEEGEGRQATDGTAAETR